MCVHQMVTRKPQVQELDLYSVLYWSRVLDRNVGAQPVQTKEDRAESDGVVFRLNSTLYLREEGSVGMSTRRLLLAQQFRMEGYQVLGLQETRVRSSTQFRCEGWLVWTAAAEAGRSRVDVWLDEGLGIDARDVTVAFESPKCLAISVPFIGWWTLFVSAHGPVADTEEEQIRLWWDTLAAELATVAQDQHVVLLIDANASLNGWNPLWWQRGDQKIWLARPCWSSSQSAHCAFHRPSASLGRRGAIAGWILSRFLWIGMRLSATSKWNRQICSRSMTLWIIGQSRSRSPCAGRNVRWSDV